MSKKAIWGKGDLYGITTAAHLETCIVLKPVVQNYHLKLSHAHEGCPNVANYLEAYLLAGVGNLMG